MAEKVGTTLVVKHTEPEVCEDCGAEAELRPYGPDGKKICVTCGMKDPVGTRMRMMEILEKQLVGVTHVVLGEGIAGNSDAVILRRGHLDEDLKEAKIEMTNNPTRRHT